MSQPSNFLPAVVWPGTLSNFKKTGGNCTARHSHSPLAASRIGRMTEAGNSLSTVSLSYSFFDIDQADQELIQSQVLVDETLRDD